LKPPKNGIDDAGYREWKRALGGRIRKRVRVVLITVLKGWGGFLYVPVLRVAACRGNKIDF
jgi:hypothetical protein